MKKYTILALSLALCASMLVGCGCSNTDMTPTAAPTTAPVTTPPTKATTAPTTEATTMPTTAATTTPTDGNMIPGGEDMHPDTGTTTEPGNSRSRSGRRMPTMG